MCWLSPVKSHERAYLRSIIINCGPVRFFFFLNNTEGYLKKKPATVYKAPFFPMRLDVAWYQREVIRSAGTPTKKQDVDTDNAGFDRNLHNFERR